MSLKRGDFSKRSGCQNKTPIVTKAKNNKNFDETLISRQMIEAFINGDYDPATVDEVREDVAICYSEENIDDVKEAQDASVEVLSKTLFRFMNSFTEPGDQKIFVPKTPIYLDLSDWLDQSAETVSFYGEDDIEVRFTWIRKDVIETNEPCCLGTLEGAILRKGKPDIGETSRSRENTANNIYLHIMRHALRKYADTFLLFGQSINIEASYYFLRKSTDKSDMAYELEDYFKDTAGIRKQVEYYTKMPEGVSFPDNTLDEIFREVLNKFATGYEKCDLKEEVDCKGCSNYLSCYFKEPPIPILSDNNEKGIKARRSIEQDEYQKVVTDYRSGTGIVDAPPGSGKTEITTERTVRIAIEMLDELVARYEAGEEVEVPVSATFLCKQSDGLESEVLVNGKTADQNWADEAVSL